MRLLLIAPQDTPDTSPRWTSRLWDEAIDLGRAPTTAYSRWSEIIGCPVRSLLEFSHGIADMQALRYQLSQLNSDLVDSLGLNWMEILAVRHCMKWLELATLERMAAFYDDACEVSLSGPCALQAPLTALFGDRLRSSKATDTASNRMASQVGRKLHALQHLTASQIADVLCDKYDAQYRLRAGFATSPTKSSEPVVLVPTAYVNVTRNAAAYARLLPNTKFLFIHTRPSAAERQSAPNITHVSLASYVTRNEARVVELADLNHRLGLLRKRMAASPFWQFPLAAGWMDSWPQELASSLAAREAWRNLLDRDPVSAVLCGDDTNPYTRIPLILAAQRGLPTVSYHHGALDGIAALKAPYARTHLAKGPMELDYLQRVCDFPEGRATIGAAAGIEPTPPNPQSAAGRDTIVFFSEAYEALGGRPLEVYRELLPLLLSLVQQHSKRLVIKLHPFESERGRKHLLQSLGIRTEQADQLQIVSGPMTPALLARAWFGITIESSAAIDCTLAGVPCFLCEWAFTFDWGYPQQYARFGGGTILQSPEQIPQIPALLAQHQPNPAFATQLAQKIKPKEFAQLLGLDFASPG